MSMPRFEWASARSAGEAAAMASATVAEAMLVTRGAGGAANSADVLKAGGIDLLHLMKEGLLAPRRLINLRGVAGLDAIEEDGAGGLRIGALATLAQVAAHPSVHQRYAALAEATAGSASPQIRSVATLGGNILQRPAAGTSAPTRSAACVAAAAAATPFTARTSTTRSSLMRFAQPSIPLLWRRRSWLWMRALSSSMPRARPVGRRLTNFSLRRKSTCSARTISGRVK